MRLDINLASQRYEDARQFWMRWGTAVALTAILTLGLLAFTAMNVVYARNDRQIINGLRMQIAKRDRDKAAAEAILNKPQNRAIRDRSQFLNGLIDRKAFSWTQVFEDLEKVMPARLHVVSIHPEMGDEQRLKIKLVVAGESRERALELVRKMEESPRFKEPQIKSDSTQMNSQVPGDNVESEIVALYIPVSENPPLATGNPQPVTEAPK
jgi:type IV pilus assembly PilN-like protein